MTLIKTKNSKPVVHFADVKLKINQKILTDFESAKSAFLAQNEDLDVENAEVFLANECEKALKKAIRKLQSQLGAASDIAQLEVAHEPLGA
jgi:hypothetical protein